MLFRSGQLAAIPEMRGLILAVDQSAAIYPWALMQVCGFGGYGNGVLLSFCICLLSQVATVAEVQTPLTVTSSNGQRTATVSLTPEGDSLGSLSTEVQKRLDATELPAGVIASIGGAATQQTESFQQLGLAMLAAIAIVYVIMVATFKSLIQPLILLVSIPFAATGAIGLLLITRVPLGLPSLIGMLMLVGIVVTNAIVLIDLINQYRQPSGDRPAMNVATMMT